MLKASSVTPSTVSTVRRYPPADPDRDLRQSMVRMSTTQNIPPFITSPYKRVVNPRLRFVLLIIDQRKVCEPCPKGFFSDKDDDEPCKPWTK